MKAWMVRYTSLIGDALLDHLVAIHVHELLRHAGQERGGEAADLRAFARGGHELVQVVRQELDVARRTGPPE